MARKKEVNNAFYDDLHEGWYEATNHPIALLRAENAARNPWILQTLKRYLQEDAEVLDIGCGAGFLSNTLAFNGYKVMGIDLSAASLSQAKERDSTGNARYLQAAAERLPFANQTFDAVCAMDLLEHVPHPLAVIQEAARVLKPGGLFFFHTFNRTYLSYFLVIKCVEWLVPNVPKQMHLYSRFIKPAELKKYLESCHLQIGELQGLIPKIDLKMLLKSGWNRQIGSDFSFVFTPSVRTGYLGFAHMNYP